MLFLLEKISPKRGGGEEGIRTLDTGLPHTPLAGERLRPLGHLSTCGDTQGGEFFQAGNPMKFVVTLAGISLIFETHG